MLGATGARALCDFIVNVTVLLLLASGLLPVAVAAEPTWLPKCNTAPGATADSWCLTNSSYQVGNLVYPNPFRPVGSVTLTFNAGNLSDYPGFSIFVLNSSSWTGTSPSCTYAPGFMSSFAVSGVIAIAGFDRSNSTNFCKNASAETACLKLPNQTFLWAATPSFSTSTVDILVSFDFWTPDSLTLTIVVGDSEYSATIPAVGTLGNITLAIGSSTVLGATTGSYYHCVSALQTSFSCPIGFTSDANGCLPTPSTQQTGEDWTLSGATTGDVSTGWCLTNNANEHGNLIYPLPVAPIGVITTKFSLLSPLTNRGTALTVFITNALGWSDLEGLGPGGVYDPIATVVMDESGLICGGEHAPLTMNYLCTKERQLLASQETFNLTSPLMLGNAEWAEVIFDFAKSNTTLSFSLRVGFPAAASEVLVTGITSFTANERASPIYLAMGSVTGATAAHHCVSNITTTFSCPSGYSFGSRGCYKTDLLTLWQPASSALGDGWCLTTGGANRIATKRMIFTNPIRTIGSVSVTFYPRFSTFDGGRGVSVFLLNASTDTNSSAVSSTLMGALTHGLIALDAIDEDGGLCAGTPSTTGHFCFVRGAAGAVLKDTRTGVSWNSGVSDPIKVGFTFWAPGQLGMNHLTSKTGMSTSTTVPMEDSVVLAFGASTSTGNTHCLSNPIVEFDCPYGYVAGANGCQAQSTPASGESWNGIGTTTGNSSNGWVLTPGITADEEGVLVYPHQLVPVGSVTVSFVPDVPSSNIGNGLSVFIASAMSWSGTSVGGGAGYSLGATDLPAWEAAVGFDEQGDFCNTTWTADTAAWICLKDSNTIGATSSLSITRSLHYVNHITVTFNFSSPVLVSITANIFYKNSPDKTTLNGQAVLSSYEPFFLAIGASTSTFWGRYSVKNISTSITCPDGYVSTVNGCFIQKCQVQSSSATDSWVPLGTTGHTPAPAGGWCLTWGNSSLETGNLVFPGLFSPSGVLRVSMDIQFWATSISNGFSVFLADSDKWSGSTVGGGGTYLGSNVQGRFFTAAVDDEGEFCSGAVSTADLLCLRSDWLDSPILNRTDLGTTKVSLTGSPGARKLVVSFDFTVPLKVTMTMSLTFLNGLTKTISKTTTNMFATGKLRMGFGAATTDQGKYCVGNISVVAGCLCNMTHCDQCNVDAGQCSLCKPGYVSYQDGCKVCDAGQYAVQAGGCKACPPGSTDHDGSPFTPCMPCPAGHFTPAGSAGDCSLYICSDGLDDHDLFAGTPCTPEPPQAVIRQVNVSSL